MRMFSRLASAVLCLFLIAGMVACTATTKSQVFRYQSDPSVQALVAGTPANYPAASFIVFSDPHLLSPALGTGPALEEYLKNDRKLLRDSTRIMDALVDAISKEKADFVLVPGDLTKDGERLDHELAATYLARIEATGKQVYVVPGNHDILNPRAASYDVVGARPVPSVTPEEFAVIYRQFGYADALYRDKGTLSYVAEPVKGLWLLALDACLYRENAGKTESVTDGAFTPQTLDWIEQMLIEATRKGKAVVVMMHHGVAEHFTGQEKYFGEYIVDNYEAVSRLFATYNVRLVFTGHYHAQDITVRRFPGNKYLFDIETGSLVTYPCPYRMVSLTSSAATLRTGRVTSIVGHTSDFQSYSRDYIESGMSNIAATAIEDFGVPAVSAEKLAGQVAEAFVAHYAGDEKLPPGQPAIDFKGTGFKGWLVVFARKGMVTGLWHDLPPADNNITISLRDGSVQP